MNEKTYEELANEDYREDIKKVLSLIEDNEKSMFFLEFVCELESLD